MAELNKMPKAQSALEYLMIIALALGIIVPTTYLFFKYGSESNVQILDSQVNQIGRDIINTAEIVYFSGEGSKIVLELNMPESVEDVYILSNRELVFKLNTNVGENEAVFFSSANIPITSVPETSGGCPLAGGFIRCDLSSIAGSGSRKIEVKSIADGSGGIEVLISKL